MKLAVYAADVVAILFAYLVARRHERHWPIVAWMIAHPVLAIVRVRVPIAEPSAILRGVYLLEHCSATALALHVLGRVAWWPAAAWWAALTKRIAVEPDPTPFYFIALWSVVAAGIASLVATRLRGFDVTDACAALICGWVAGDLVVPAWSHLEQNRRLAIVILSVLCLIQGANLWRSSVSSPPAPSRPSSQP